jgi:adenylate cyclase
MDEIAKDKQIQDLSPNEVLQIYLMEGPGGLRRRTPLKLAPRMFLESGILKYIPSNPRCVWCQAPFKGLGAPFMKAIGKDKSKFNPTLCTECEDFVRQHNAGVETEMSMLFADIRGSTSLAEKLSAVEFSSVINRFYSVASDILAMEKGFLEKLAGDQVSAFFIPGLAGKEHYQHALNAARKILMATGHSDPKGPWVPVGIGIHIGQTFFGAVGKAEGLTDLAFLGDPPNTAARLASSAKAGEVLISAPIAERLQLDKSSFENRKLTLKGKAETVDVWVLDLTQPAIVV